MYFIKYLRNELIINLSLLYVICPYRIIND